MKSKKFYPSILKNLGHSIYFIVVLTFLAACDQNKSNTIESEDESDVVYFENDDTAMNNAIAKAKETFDEFETHYQNENNENFSYSIKHGFSTPDGGKEHIWIDVIDSEGNNFVGIVANEPFSTSDVAYGDTVTLNKNQISDWMIVDNEKMTAKGGYTIRVIRENMSAEEQQEFDSNYGLTFE